MQYPTPGSVNPGPVRMSVGSDGTSSSFTRASHEQGGEIELLRRQTNALPVLRGRVAIDVQALAQGARR